VKVFGLNQDSVKSHAKFASKLGLGYSLIADEDRALLTKLGLWKEKSMYGRKFFGVARTTFLVGADGKVERVWRKVKPAGHAAEVLSTL